jgi:hypothetical protein
MGGRTGAGGGEGGEYVLGSVGTSVTRPKSHPTSANTMQTTGARNDRRTPPPLLTHVSEAPTRPTGSLKAVTSYIL